MDNIEWGLLPNYGAVIFPPIICIPLCIGIDYHRDFQVYSSSIINVTVIYVLISM